MKKLWFGGLLVPTLSLAPGVNFAQSQVKIQREHAADKNALIKKQIDMYNKSIALAIDTQQKIVENPKIKTEDKIKRILLSSSNLITKKNLLMTKLKTLKLKDEKTKVVDQDILDILLKQLNTTTEHKDLLSNVPELILSLTEINHVDFWRMDSKIMEELKILDEVIDNLNNSIREKDLLLSTSDAEKVFKNSVKQIDSAKNISNRMISLNTTVTQQNYEDLVKIADDETDTISLFLLGNITRMETEDNNSVKLFQDKKLGTGEAAIDELDKLKEHFLEQQSIIEQGWVDIIKDSGIDYKELTNFHTKFIDKINKKEIIETIKELKITLAAAVYI